MINIAILASRDGGAAASICQSLNSGSRMRVSLLISDRENSAVPELAEIYGSEGIYLAREIWHDDPASIEDILRSNDIGYLILTDFMSPLPAGVEQAYAGRITRIASDAPLSPDELVRLMQTIRQASGRPSSDEVSNPSAAAAPAPAAAPVAEEKGDVPPSPDEQWARSLGVPPPVNPIPVTPPPHPQITAHNQPPAAQPISPAADTKSGSVAQGAPANPEETMPPTYLVWSVITALLCCFIPGVVAIVFSSQVSSRYYAGDIEGARKNSRRAEIWIIVSFVLGLISSTVMFPLMFFAG